MIASSLFPIFSRDRERWKTAVQNSANMLKPDGLLITEIVKRSNISSKLFKTSRVRMDEPITMTKQNALEHAEKCFGKYLEECSHYSIIEDSLKSSPNFLWTYDKIICYFPRWLSSINLNNYFYASFL